MMVGRSRAGSGRTMAPRFRARSKKRFSNCRGNAARGRGAGRTDAGVHARGQVAHFDQLKEFPPDTVRDALNAHLRPNPIAVLEAAIATEDFHARFSAVARHYEYRMLCRRAPPAVERGHVWHV